MSPKKDKGTKGGKKGAPKGGFSGGKLSSPLTMKGGKKDPRHILNLAMCAPKVMPIWFRKFNKDEEAFAGPWLRGLMEDPDRMEALGIAAVVKRKGADGVTPLPQKPGTMWAWQQVLVIIGDDGDDPQRREEIASAIMSDFNEHARRPLFEYPTRMRFGRDYTAADPVPADVYLLDSDVCCLMQNCYEADQLSLEDLKEHDDIMALWWSDLDAGRAAMDAFIENEEHENHTDSIAHGSG